MNTQIITRSLGKMSFQLKKHAPTILMGVGAVGTVASTVMACKATTKVSGILETTKEQVDQIHEVAENPEKYNAEYTEEDAKKDLVIVYAKTGVEMAKLYAPAVALGALSLGCMFVSHGMMRKRNFALMAAYTAVDKGFKEYRGRVVERFGEVVDRELKYGLKAEKVVEIETDPETGKEKKVKKTIDVVGDVAGYSPYAKFFDDASSAWEKNAETNLYFLRCQENIANEMLASRGHLFLNEVYDMLCIPRTEAGSEVGWVYNSERGDSYVDFGIYETHRATNRDFVNGYEAVILLDFNVDGPIKNKAGLAKY